jgi:hypothetical protein
MATSFLMNDPDTCSQPDFRATIVRGQLTIVGWQPHLMSSWGPCNTHLRNRNRDRAGIGIADLSVIREPDQQLELIVKFLCGGHRADVRDAITGWAASLGYRRVWLPDEIIELDGADVAAGERASTRCRTCRTRWEDDDPDFWLTARRWGIFPLVCPLCGGDLPQWQVERGSTGPSMARNGRK